MDHNNDVSLFYIMETPGPYHFFYKILEISREHLMTDEQI